MRLLPLLAVLLAAAGPAAAEGDNPWLEGDDAALPDALAPEPLPPRESPRAREPLVRPEVPPDTFKVRPPPPAPAAPDLRFATELSQSELLQFGDLSLPGPLVLVPGLELPGSLARGELLSARGHGPEHVMVRLDGVPIVPSAAYPRFPVVALLDPMSVERATFRHGPRLDGIGGGTGAGGVLDLETLPAPVTMGTGVPLSGSLRAGWGGPALEQALLAAGATGFGPGRVGLTAGVQALDALSLGRGEGLLERSGAIGGHLGARVDVSVAEGLRVFASWRSARHAANPYPLRCPGTGADCVLVDERALDLFWAGADLAEPLLGARLEARVRAHAQHAGERTQRQGSAVAQTQTAADRVFRAGGLVDLGLALPALPLPGRLPPLAPRLFLHAELLRDRVGSTFATRSRRTTDAVPPDSLLHDPARAQRVDDATALSAATTVGADATLGPLATRAAVRFGGQHASAPAGERLPDPLEHGSAGLSAELAARARLTQAWALFAALTRVERGDRLAALTYGGGPLDAGGAPAARGADRFLEHGAELGLRYALPWLRVEGAMYGAVRAGLVIEGAGPLEAGPPESVLGVEGRVRYQTGLPGLAGLATLGAALLDDGLPFAADTVPQSQATPPFGLALLEYAPPGTPFGVYARMRYALPQTRLSPAEADDVRLCPESTRPDLGLPCRGAGGYGLFDLGGRFVTSGELLRLDALVENVLDQPWRLYGHPLPGGGLGARFTATLRL